MAACVRIYRRIIVRQFGGAKNCLTFFSALLVTVYLMDRLLFTNQKSLSGKDNNKADNNLPLIVLPSDSPAVKVKPVVSDEVKPSENKLVPPVTKLQSRKCGATIACPDGKYTYYLKSGIGRDGMPTVCFNGNNIISPEKKNADRGFNIVVINDKTLDVEDVRTFDVYVSDAVLQRYLKFGVQDGHLIFAVTLDEASYNLRDESRVLLKLFGSNLVDKIKFRDNFIMIGQKGLASGTAIEKYLARDQGQEFGETVDMSGCLSIPVGKLEKLSSNGDSQKAADGEDIKVGEAQPNCGVTTDCGDSAFSVHLYSGRENKDMAKLCINGKYIFGQGLNDAGRGLNIAIVNPSTKDVYRVGHFDTFEADTSNLEIFLEMLNENDIILIVSHDEASTNINLNIQRELQILGSHFISKLSFRDAWVFVGQKGIVGKSPFEEIEYAGAGWPKPVDKKFCVPTVLKGVERNSSAINAKRLIFCRKYRDNGDFCAGSKIDLPLSFTLLRDKGLEGHEIFKIPILVIPSATQCQYNDLRLQLEALLQIPGLHSTMVVVFYTEASPECGEIADVFDFHSVKMNTNVTSYAVYLQLVLEYAWTKYLTTQHLIVLEENVIPSPDLLSLFAQCFQVLSLDESLAGITAWNENGYDGISSRPDLVYRAETFPGLGFILKKSFYDQYLRGNASECCSERSWNGWLQGKLGEVEMLVPDVSRAFRQEVKDSAVTTELFGRKRTTSLEDATKISDVSQLTKTGYEKELHKLIESSTALDAGDSSKCFSGADLGFNIPETEGKVYSIYYEQSDLKDQTVLSALARCFKLFSVKGQPVRGTHRGLLRFSYKKNLIFLIGSTTKYYKHKPLDYKPIMAKTQTN